MVNALATKLLINAILSRGTGLSPGLFVLALPEGATINQRKFPPFVFHDSLYKKANLWDLADLEVKREGLSHGSLGSVTFGVRGNYQVWIRRFKGTH